MQRSANKHAAGASDDRVSLSSLVKYLKEAHAALESADDEDAALRFELLIDYLTSEYSPSKGLKFETKHLGL